MGHSVSLEFLFSFIRSHRIFNPPSFWVIVYLWNFFSVLYDVKTMKGYRATGIFDDEGACRGGGGDSTRGGGRVKRYLLVLHVV